MIYLLKKLFTKDVIYIWAGAVLICLVVGANEPKGAAILFGIFLIIFGGVRLIVKRCDDGGGC